MKSILQKKDFFKITSLFSISLLSILSFQAHAKIGDNIKAIPPYHIKPNTSSAAPSGLSPAQVVKAYNFSAIANQGQGQIIAIIDAFDHPNAEADLGVFSSTFGLPPCTTANGCFQKIFANGTPPAPDVGWGVEIALDIQWAHAIAPQAKIMLVEAGDNSFTNLFKAINVAIQNGANVISMSWGSSEFSNEGSFDPTFNIPNIAFTAASGDNGHGIWYPASSPFVIGVGGTTLNVDASGNYLSEVAWSGSGGGISAFEAAPAYQLNFPLPNNPNNMRGEPDVAYGADPNTGFAVYDTFGHNGWLVIGGTSAGAPQWAALIAIAKSAAGNPLNGINATLYNIAKANYGTNYNDITTGSNGTCGVICNASVGYDYVTGLGSPKAGALIQTLSNTSGGGGGRIPI